MSSSKATSSRTRSFAACRAGTSSTARCRTGAPRGFKGDRATGAVARTRATQLRTSGVVARAAISSATISSAASTTNCSGCAMRRQPFTNPSYYFDNGLDPSTYVTVPYAPVDQRLRAFIKYAKQIPASVHADPREPAAARLPRTFIDYGSKSFSGFAGVLSQRRAAGVCRSAGRTVAEGAAEVDRAGRTGDARHRQVDAEAAAGRRPRHMCSAPSASPPCCA